MFSSEFKAHFKEQIEQEIALRSGNIGEGKGIKDYADYRETVGFLRGLRWALGLLKNPTPTERTIRENLTSEKVNYEL